MTCCTNRGASSLRPRNLAIRLRLEAPARFPDGSGGATLSWNLLGEVWGDVRAVNGIERLQDDRLEARATHTITIRWRADISPSNRFVWGERIFAVHAILDRDGTRRSLTCLTEETQA